jgi:arginine decarboxylase
MNDKRIEAPIFNRLNAYKDLENARFHVPGHKGGAFFLDQAKPLFSSMLEIDVTEITGMDDLHDPQEIIAEAQQLASTCFTADQTYFLVNGSTVGNLAMIMATLQKGDQVLVQRNSHKSVFHALAMVEVEAIFLQPECCPTFNVPVGVTLDQVKEAFNHYPKLKAFVLTYPNYYGMASEIREIIQYAHQQDAVVLVDEAHGAHFGQHKALPPSAMQLGADVSVQSTHKMLGSMTMTSMLHVQGKRVDIRDLEFYLHSLQSSSPSYPLLASLDVAREQLQRMNHTEWDQSFAQYEYLRVKIRSINRYSVSYAGKEGNHPLQKQTLYNMDPFKLIIQPIWGMTGYQLQRLLEEYGIYSELADTDNVLLTLPLVPKQEWNERLIDALQSIALSYAYLDDHTNTGLPVFTSHSHKNNKHTDLTKIKMKTYRSSDVKEVSLHQSKGERVAEMIIPYPPGIPILIPGEAITQGIIDYILALQHRGAHFQGKGKRKFNTILVAQ